MKQLVLGLVLGAGLALAGVVLTASLGERGLGRARRTLTVTGSATVRVPPDLAHIDFALLTEGATAAEARKKSEDSVKRLEDDLRKALQKLTLAKVDILKKDRLLKGEPPPEMPDPLPGVARIPLGEEKDQPPGKAPAYGVVTWFTVEVEAADFKALQAAARAAGEVALRHKATYDPDAASLLKGPDRTAQVVFGLTPRRTAAERLRALEEAVAAARGEAQQLAGPGVPIDVIDVSEPAPAAADPALRDIAQLLLTDPRLQVAGDQGPGPGGVSAPRRPATAVDLQLTRMVVLKCAY
jgi:hypothetical protein